MSQFPGAKWFLTALICSSTLTSAQMGLTPKTISNGQVTLKYRLGGSNGFWLASIGDQQEPKAFDLDPQQSPWSIQFRDSVSGALTIVEPSDCTYTIQHSKTASSFSVTWVNCTHTTIPTLPVFDVTITGVTPANDMLAELRLSLEVKTPGTPLQSVFLVDFPRIRFYERRIVPDLDATQAELAWPYAAGRVVLDPVHNLVTFRTATGPIFGNNPGREMDMQFLSYYERGEYSLGGKPANLFLGTRDLEGYYKLFGLGPATVNDNPDVNKESFPVTLRVPLENNEDNLTTLPYNYAMSYPFTIGVLRGDWYEACRYYREWIMEPTHLVPWVTQGPMHSDPDFSPAVIAARAYADYGVDRCDTSDYPLSNCPVDTQYADHSLWQNWLLDLQDQANYFGFGSDLLMRVWGWDNYSFYGYFGEWLPAADAFVEAAAQVRQAGYKFDAYFNTNGYQSTSLAPSVSLMGSACGGASPTLYPISDSTIVKIDGTLDTEMKAPKLSRTPAGGCPNCSTPSPDAVAYTLDQQSPFIGDYLLHYSREVGDLTFADPMGNLPAGANGLYVDDYIDNYPKLSYGAYGKGGGKNWTQKKLEYLRELRTQRRMCDPDFFLHSEGNEEMYLGLCEIDTDRHLARQTFRRANAGVVGQWTAPLYQVVYHDFKINAMETRPINQPSSFPDLADYKVNRQFRQEASVALYYGCLPSFGSKLASDGMPPVPDTISHKLATFPEYASYVHLLEHYCKILNQDPVRRLTVFGERMRDPATTCTRFSTDVDVEFADAYLSDGRLDPNDSTEPLSNQPYVYVAAFVRTPPPPGGRPDLGLLLLNWTYATDTTPPVTIPPIAPYTGAGSQTFDIEIDPTVYGLSGNYLRQEADQMGGMPINQGTVSLNGTLVLSSETVPEASARFLLFTPQ